MTDVNLINGIALAFEGDAVYSMYIRRHLIFQGLTKPNQLQDVYKRQDHLYPTIIKWCREVVKHIHIA